MAQAAPGPIGALLAGVVHLAGGVPSPIPDIPICSVLLVFYVVGAVGNYTWYQRYNKRLLWQMGNFGFCMSRIATMATRIAWAKKQTNTGLATASQVFTNAGTVALIIVIIMMCKKAFFRTHYAYLQSHASMKAAIKWLFTFIGVFLLIMLIIVITGAVQGILATDPSIQRTDTILKRIGLPVFFVYSCMPYLFLAANAIWFARAGQAPKYLSEQSTSGIGQKTWPNTSTVLINTAILVVATSLLVFEYGFKVVQIFESPLVDRWYLHKGAYYGLGFVPELIVTYILLFANMPARYAGLVPIRNQSYPEGDTKRRDIEKITPAS